MDGATETRVLTKQQRAALEVLLDEGPLTQFNLRRLVPTSANGLSRIVNHLTPLVAYSHDAEVYYVPREYRQFVEVLLDA